MKRKIINSTKLIALFTMMFLFCSYSFVYGSTQNYNYYYYYMDGKLYKIYFTTKTITNNNINKENEDVFKDTIYYCNTSLKESLKIDETVKQRAQDLVKTEMNDYNKAFRIYDFVSKYLIYDHSRAYLVTSRGNMCNWQAGAQYAYNTRTGICFEYATLFAAMARSIGLKVRLIYGNSHIWNEIYDSQNKRWVSVDATWKMFNFNVNQYHTEYKIHAEI